MISVGIEETQNQLVTAHDALSRLHRMYQRPLETNDEYMEQFKEYWGTGEAATREICLEPDITKSSKNI